MNFVTGPLVWPLECSKQRPLLRECTILLRKSMNIHGIEDAVPAISNLEQHFVSPHFIRARHAINFHKRTDQLGM